MSVATLVRIEERDRVAHFHCSKGHHFTIPLVKYKDYVYGRCSTIFCQQCQDEYDAKKAAAEQVRQKPTTTDKPFWLPESKEFDFGPLGEKHVKKYMRQAKQIADDNKACLSRGIGVVIVKVREDGTSRVLGTGYNGPPAKTPHCDSQEYLAEMVLPQLTTEEKTRAARELVWKANGGQLEYQQGTLDQIILKHGSGCGQCPRRLVGAKSGTRLELCSCEHAERNAIYNATEDLYGSWMFAWCPVACWDCAKAICQAGVKTVFFRTDPSYGEAYQLDRSCFLFRKRGIRMFIAPPDYYLDGCSTPN